MSHAVLIESLPDGSSRKISVFEPKIVQSVEQANYTLIDETTQLPPAGMRLICQGEDLKVEVEDEVVATIEDFYAEGSTVSFTVDGSLIPFEGSDAIIVGSVTVADIGSESVVWSQETGLSSGDSFFSAIPWWEYALGGVAIGAGLAMGGGGSSDPYRAPTATFIQLRPAYLEADAGKEVAYAFKITRDADSIDRAATIEWEVSGAGVDPANADDFGGAFPQGTVEFEIGESWKIITFNVSGDTDLEEHESFIVTLSDDTGNLVPNVYELSGAIYNDEIADQGDGDTYVATGMTNDGFEYSQIGGTGDDSLSVTYSADNDLVNWDVGIAADDGIDEISVNLDSEININNNVIDLFGDAGDDNIVLSLDADAGISGNFGVNVNNYVDTDGNPILDTDGNNLTYDDYDIQGGDGNDTVAINMEASLFSLNNLGVSGDAYGDTINLDFLLKSTVGNGWSNEDYQVHGGSGSDALAVSLGVADGVTSFANFQHNDIYLNGGTEDDLVNFSFDMTDVAMTGGATNNVVAIYGDTGNDTLHFEWLLNGTGSVDSSDNEITLSGGSGYDDLSVEFDVLSGSNNEITIDGGNGFDNINIEIDSTDALASFNYSTTADLGDSITGLIASNDFEFQFAAAAFNGSTTVGEELDADNFVSSVDAVALDEDDYWLYDTDSFELYYDADGSGAGEAQLVVSFDANVAIDASQINLYEVV